MCETVEETYKQTSYNNLHRHQENVGTWPFLLPLSNIVRKGHGQPFKYFKFI